MTKEQLQILNDSISNIKLLCKQFDYCRDCPMNTNCGEIPLGWQALEEN